MRNMLALAALVVLTFFGLGWYLDWYKIQTTPTADGRAKVTLDINAKKVTSDVGNEVRNILDKTQSAASGLQNGANPLSPANYQSERDGGSVFPAQNITPVPPSNGPRLPVPQ